MQKKTAVLLVNLGTPKSPSNWDVYRYLIEFLTDERVIDMPWLKRQLLVRGVIVPTRYRQSAKAYQAIWKKEGSPLMIYGESVQRQLQEALGDSFYVALAMRYQQPSIASQLAILMAQKVEKLIVLPLFPHYASATTGSVHQKVLEELSRYLVIPHTRLISEYAVHPLLIEAFCAVANSYRLENYDHILFSFHGLPERHLKQATASCQCNASCCDVLDDRNRNCYSAQCYATAYAIAKQLNLTKENYSIAFQSRLGRDPWLQPYTSDQIKKLAQSGKRRVLVFCPSFVSDCLETIYEIGVEYNIEFQHAGGEKLELVTGLNDHPKWIEALKSLVLHG